MLCRFDCLEGLENQRSFEKERESVANMSEIARSLLCTTPRIFKPSSVMLALTSLGLTKYS